MFFKDFNIHYYLLNCKDFMININGDLQSDNGSPREMYRNNRPVLKKSNQMESATKRSNYDNYDNMKRSNYDNMKRSDYENMSNNNNHVNMKRSNHYDTPVIDKKVRKSMVFSIEVNE